MPFAGTASVPICEIAHALWATWGGQELWVYQGLAQGCRGWLGSLFCFLINYNSFPSAASLGLKSHLP